MGLHCIEMQVMRAALNSQKKEGVCSTFLIALELIPDPISVYLAIAIRLKSNQPIAGRRS